MDTSFVSQSSAQPDPREMYLDLLKRCLTRQLIKVPVVPLGIRGNTWKRRVADAVQNVLAARRLTLARLEDDAETKARRRAEEPDFWTTGETMLSRKRLDNVHRCVVEALQQGVPGDLIETGVWRGGTTILMRAILRVYGEAQRCVWVADSFQGVPKPDASKYPADAGSTYWTYDHMAVSADDVRANFARYDQLDENVRFLEGWFSETLPTAPIRQLAVMRLDGDIYESTMDALKNLYPKLSAGGYVIIDDYGDDGNCRAAVEDYRREHGIADEIQRLDESEVFWKNR